MPLQNHYQTSTMNPIEHFQDENFSKTRFSSVITTRCCLTPKILILFHAIPTHKTIKIRYSNIRSWKTCLAIWLEDKFQELPTVWAPIQPVIAPIDHKIEHHKFIYIYKHTCIYLFVLRERDKRGTLGREEAEEGGALQGECTDMPSCSSSLGFPPPLPPPPFILSFFI